MPEQKKIVNGAAVLGVLNRVAEKVVKDDLDHSEWKLRLFKALLSEHPEEVLGMLYAANRIVDMKYYKKGPLKNILDHHKNIWTQMAAAALLRGLPLYADRK